MRNITFDKTISIFAILIAVYGILLTCQGNKIANAAFQLSKNDSSQRYQLDTLSTIVANQKVQIDTLVLILKTLRVQNEIANVQTDFLKTQSRQALNQTKILTTQQKISLETQKVDNNLNLMQSKANRNKFASSVKSINDLFYNVYEKIGFLNRTFKELENLDTDKKLHLLEGVKSNLEEELMNPFLLADDSLHLVWTNFQTTVHNCRLTLRDTTVFRFGMPLDSTGKSITDTLRYSDNKQISETMRKSSFNNLLKEYSRFYNFTIDRLKKSEVLKK